MKKVSTINKQWMVAATLVLLGLTACGGKPDEEKKAAKEAEKQEERLTSVSAVPVKHEQLKVWIYSQGTVRSRQREFLTFTQPGLIKNVDPNLRIGSKVRAGQVIAYQAPERVTADLQAAKAALDQANADLEFAKVTQRRYETLIEQRSAAKQELDQAIVQVEQAKAARERARAQLAQAQLGVNESRLVSPINGVLARLNIESGRYYMPNTLQTNSEQGALRTVPAMVIDPTRLEVRVDFPSYHFRQIKEGAKVLLGGDPPVEGRDIDPTTRNKPIEGRVHAVSPALDPESRTFEVVSHVQGQNLGLHDGEFVAVWVQDPNVKDALAVPVNALRHRGDQAFVFVFNKDTGRVSERPVELGQQSGDHRVVVSGISEGDLVVTDGRAALNDGQKVQLLNSGGDGK